MKLFGKKKDNTPLEEVNTHFVFIEVPLEVVADEVIKWGEASWWPKNSSAKFTKTTEGDIKVGTRYKMQIAKAPTKWDVEVTKLEPGKLIERTFLSGMFKGGHEIVKIEWRYNGTRVDYELRAPIVGFINKILWTLVFRKKHDANIKMILEALKNYALSVHKDNEDKRLEGL